MGETTMSKNSESVSCATVSQMLALIRASLWQTPVECQPFDVLPIDWDEIGRMSEKQTVGPLAFTTALKMPENRRPPKEWILKAYALIKRNRRTHDLLDRCVAESCCKLSEKGIRPVLLKGQAYALAYPDKALRQCGDIDLYVGEENYRNAYLVTKELGWESNEQFDPNAKHYGCSLNGVRIELHRVAGILPTFRSNMLFQKWSHRQLQVNRYIDIEGKDIAVPTPLFDVLFVFKHMYNHFINGGIGLRHVCDWAMLLHAHHKEIDTVELERFLKDFRLLRGWRLFAPIAVRYLGLPENECPLYSRKYFRNAERILSFIIKEGNFGRATGKKTRRPKSYPIRKLYSFVWVTGKLAPKLSIDPQLILMEYINLLRDGVIRVLKDINNFIRK